MIYLDYAATTPVAPAVRARYLYAQDRYFANTMALHALGSEANVFYEQEKARLLRALSLPTHEAVYVSNATEANNLALLGYLKNKSGRILASPVEHASLDEPLKALSRENPRLEVDWLAVDQGGRVDLQDLERKLDKTVLLVVVQWVNNVIGTIEPVRAIHEALSRFPRARLLVDIVQGIGKESPDFALSDIDFLTFSTHKIYGPKGVGVLLYRKSLSLSPLLLGARDQDGLKPGTFDPALVAATTEAVSLALSAREENHALVSARHDEALAGLRELPGVVINSPIDASPYIVNFSLPGHAGETVVHALEARGICVSTGSACASRLVTPDRVLLATGASRALALSSIRVSLSHQTTPEEIASFLGALKGVLNV